MEQIGIASVFSILNIGFELMMDRELYKRRIKPFYWIKRFNRIAVYLLIGLASFYATNSMYYGISGVILSLSLFWFLFDGLYNVLIKQKDWFERGKTSGPDKFFNKSKWFFQILSLLISIIIQHASIKNIITSFIDSVLS